MRTSIACTVLAALTVGCASAGSGGEGQAAAPVPVYYRNSSAIPCEYEVIRSVRRSANVPARSTNDFERMRDDLLGRAGAEIGADAVIVEDLRGRPGRTVRVPAGSPPPTPRAPTYEGDAVRFIEGTCR